MGIVFFKFGLKSNDSDILFYDCSMLYVQMAKYCLIDLGTNTRNKVNSKIFFSYVKYFVSYTTR